MKKGQTDIQTDICTEKLRSGGLYALMETHQQQPRNLVHLFYTSELRRWDIYIYLNEEASLAYPGRRSL